MICVVRALGGWGGSVVWTGGLSELDCCSPVAKCSKDEVGNGQILGFWEMGCDFFGGERWARGDGSVVWTGGLSELDCCSPVAKCSKDEVGNGRIMGFGRMGCDFFGGDVGRVGREVLSGLGVV